ncbi:MAG: hypothetical protein EOO85_11590 [Pedobacter sp.]|nr:MAG: hypothetical protein EOO85_11590 [Pedobacter sp.]
MLLAVQELQSNYIAGLHIADLCDVLELVATHNRLIIIGGMGPFHAHPCFEIQTIDLVTMLEKGVDEPAAIGIGLVIG